MGKVEKYCDLLLQAGGTKFNDASKGGNLFLNGYLHGTALPAGHKTRGSAGDLAGPAVNQNELAVIFAFEPHPVTFA